MTTGDPPPSAIQSSNQYSDEEIKQYQSIHPGAYPPGYSPPGGSPDKTTTPPDELQPVRITPQPTKPLVISPANLQKSDQIRATEMEPPLERVTPVRLSTDEQADNSKSSSNDEFQSLRQQAIKTGSFDYSADHGAVYYSPPKNFVNDKGDRVDLVGRPAPSDETTPIPEPKNTTTLLDQYDSKELTFTFSPEKKTPVVLSKGTQAFNADQALTIMKLTEAKKAGITELDIFNSKGEKVGQTNPQDVTRARYDILKESILLGEPVTVKGSIVNTNNIVNSTNTTYTRNNDNEFKALVAGTVEPGAYIGLAFAGGVADLLGKPVLGVKPGATSEDINSQIQKSIGPTYLDQAMSGDLNNKNMTPTEKAASVIGSAAGFIFTSGGKIGLGPIKTGIEEKLAQLGIVKGSKALQEGELTSNLERPSKTNPNYEFSQGTIAKSGITEIKIEKAPIQVRRTPEGKVEAIQPGLPPGIKETKTIDVLGQTGTKTVETKPTDEDIANRYPLFGKGSNDISDLTKGEIFKAEPATQTKPTFGKVEKTVPNVIELNPKLEGPATIPEAIINPKGSTLLVRSSPQTDLPVNAIVAKNITPGEAVHLGLEPVPGQKGVYYSELTGHLQEKINEGILGKTLVTGTDLFQYKTSDFFKDSEFLSSAARNPEIYGNVFDTKLRPFVIRYIEGRGTYNLKKPIKEISLAKKPQRSFTEGQFALGNIEIGPTSPGAAARAANLLKDTSDMLPKGLTPGKVSAYVKAETPGEINLSLNQNNQSRYHSVIDTSDLVYEKIVYPPGHKPTSSEKLSSSLEDMTSIKSKIDLKIDMGMDILSKSKSESVLKNKSDQSSKLSSKLKLSMDTDTALGQMHGLITGGITTTKQTTKEKLITTTEQITIPGRPPPKRPPGLAPSFGLEIPELFRNKLKKHGVGKVKVIYFAWNVNSLVPGGYLPGKELRIGKSAKVITQTEKLERKVNRNAGTKVYFNTRKPQGPKKRSDKKQSKEAKETFKRLDRSIAGKNLLSKKKKWF